MIEKKEKALIKINQNTIFHFYAHHKEVLNEFRVWFVARHFVDTSWAWRALIKDLCKATWLTNKYLRRVCFGSEFIAGMNADYIYFKSLVKVMEQHELALSTGMTRYEKNTANCRKQFIGDKEFKAFITKCFAETQLEKNKRYRFTQGKIGYWTMAKYFGISRKTAITNIKNSKAKPIKNERLHKNIVFGNMLEFWVWLSENMENIIGWIKVVDQPSSFFVKKIKTGEYCLRQVLPNRYKFTGVSLVRASFLGARLNSSNKKHKGWCVSKRCSC